MSIDAYIDGLIRREGGYVDHPADRGGPTNWGITEAVARAFGYQGEMRDMPQDIARAIYRERYWTQPKFDQVNAISPMLAEELLDTGVNMGSATAARFLQRALNVLNREGQSWPDVAVDGSIGRMTLAALHAFLRERGPDAQHVLWQMLNAQQAVRYIEIAEARPSQEAFMYGWQAHRVGM